MFENGHKKYIGGYKEDKKDGKWQEWDLDGEIQVDGIYKNGDKWDGAFNSLIYSNGVKAILSQDYYNGGSSIKEEGLILGENKIGEWTYWHENGEKKAEGNISNNQKWWGKRISSEKEIRAMSFQFIDLDENEYELIKDFETEKQHPIFEHF